MSRDVLFSYRVLRIIGRLGSAYSTPILDALRLEREEADVSQGALYTTLARLELKGFVISDRRPDGRRRYYTLTPAGIEALKAMQQSLMLKTG